MAELKAGRSEASGESPHSQTLFPDPVRQYVRRAFEVGSERADLSEKSMMYRLKSIITNSVHMLDSTDWELLPLPQSTKWDGLWDRENIDENVRRLLTRYTNEHS